MHWLAALFPICAAPVVYRLGRNRGRTGLALVAVAVAVVAWLLAYATVNSGPAGAYAWNDFIVLRLAVSPITSVFLLTVPPVAALILWFAAVHESVAGLSRLLALLLVFTGAMQLLVLAADLLTLLIAWEIVSACSWALIAHEWREQVKVKSANRAFLVSRLGDLGLFVAVFAAFAATGSFAYADLSAVDGALLHVFVAGVLLAAAAKSAQVPFSPWLFAAMAGPVSVSALLHAATMVAAGIFILIHLHDVLSGVAWFGPTVLSVGLVTAIAGGLVASSQWHAKKLLAASTSAHYGFMWIAVGAGYPAVAAVHFVTHAAMKAGLFLAAGAVGGAAKSYDLRHMALGRQWPRLAFATLIATLAVAGLFPLGAAWSKEKIISAAGHAGTAVALLTIVAGMLCGVYAARFQVYLFGRGDSKPQRAPPETAAVSLAALASIALSLLWWPGIASEIETFFAGKVPAFKLWEFLLSMLLLAIGAAGGIWLVARDRALQGPMFAQWMALPWLGERCLERPLTASARGLANFDNRFDDYLCHSAMAVGRRFTQYLAGWDNTVIDRSFLTLAGFTPYLARWDNQVINRAVLAVAGFGDWLAQASARSGERLAELIPAQSASLSKRGAARVRQLQTGLSYHYYTLAAVGVVLLVVVIAFGGWI